jgi:L-lysine 6-transaminase
MIDSKKIKPESVHQTITKYMLFSGLKIVIDFKSSSEGYIYDSLSDQKFLDMFSFFGSAPLRLNHPKMLNREFLENLNHAALSKPSNSDFYSVEMAEFVDTFSRNAIPDFLPHLFLIEGGALAVENALKVSFDWKVKKNFLKGYKQEKGFQVIHFKEAFHGRTGYTMSLTNTDPNKINYFPKFKWPRITNPKLRFQVTQEVIDSVIVEESRAIDEIFFALKENKDDVACIIIEPIQAEGGDNHFRKEFFLKLRDICDENEILLIFDEVQTGIGITGKMWAYEHFIQPDIIAFGKKMQVCGIMVSSRIDDVEENCFREPYRINSTWGGNLTDMMRAKRYLEIIIEDNLIANAKNAGDYLLKRLIEVQSSFPNIVSNARGLGLMCAFDLPSKEFRDELKKEIFKNKMIILQCGERSLRFRPTLDVQKEHIDSAIDILFKSLRNSVNK